MKNYLLSLMLLPIMAAAQDKYTLTGQISNMNEPGVMYMALDKGTAFVDVDSVPVKNGHFQFVGSLNNPARAILTLKRNDASQTKERDQLVLFLENSIIEITADSFIKDGFVSGSYSDAENKKLEAAIRPLTNSIIRLNNKFGGKPKDEAYKQASDSVTQLVDEIRNIRLKFAQTHLDSYIGLYVYNVNVLDSKFDPAKVDPLFHQFTASLQSSELGRKSLEKIESAKRRQAGVAVTNFTQNELNGKPFSLASLRGKYVLVDFWASWCAPCRAENPNLKEAYSKLKNKNFEVVGVSLDENKSAWANAVKKDGLPWIHVCDLKGWKNDVATLYGISSVPQNILINPEGVIIAKNLRGEDLTQKLSALIK